MNCDQLLLSLWWVLLSTVKVQYKLPCRQDDSSRTNDLIDITLASKAKIHHYGIKPCIVPQFFFFFIHNWFLVPWWSGICLWITRDCSQGVMQQQEAYKMCNQEASVPPFACVLGLKTMFCGGVRTCGQLKYLNLSCFCLMEHCSFHALWSPVLHCL